MKQRLPLYILILLFMGGTASTTFGSVPAFGSEQIDRLSTASDSLSDSIPGHQELLLQDDQPTASTVGQSATATPALDSRTDLYRQPGQRISKRRLYKPPYPDLPADSVRKLKRQRGLTSMSNTFVPQGQWVVAINASFSTHSNNNYSFVVIDGIDSEGHTIKVAPALGYALSNNMVVGIRFSYARTFLRIDNGSIQLGDDDTGVDLKADYFYSLKHTYQASLIWRQYIPLGNNKRFAIFNETQLGMGRSQAKFAADSPIRGTYETGKIYSIGISPGLVAFATNNMAVELNVGVLGFTYNQVKQVHNQVTVGKRNLSTMNFKVNIFSIGLGVAFYL